VLAFCGYGLATEWRGVQAALGRMHWYAVAGSAIAAMAGAGAMMMAWRALLADLGSPLPVPVAARITFVGQLGKYVPGAIWSFAAHVELGYDYRVPRVRGAASVLMALAVAIGMGLVIAAVGLPLASVTVARHYLWIMAAIPVLVACLCPPVLGRLTDGVLRVIRMQPLARRLTWRGLAVVAGWTALGWLLYGMQVWVPLASETGRGIHVLDLAVAGYALACSAALVLVVFPNGIGPREVILIAALAPVIDRPAALALALIARVTTTISDMAWGAIGLAAGRRAPATLATAASSPDIGGAVAAASPSGGGAKATASHAGAHLFEPGTQGLM
jgi:hypothetical protein